MFSTFFHHGWTHIFEGGLDHILYLSALVIPYIFGKWRDFKSLLVLITAFTIGHFISLSLAMGKLFFLSSETVEQIIPWTIVATALYNILFPIKKYSTSTFNSLRIYYASALFFGLIHGMAYSNDVFHLIKDSTDYILVLLGFNIGLELAQILVTAALYVVLYLLAKALSFHHTRIIRLYTLVLIGVLLYSIM